MMSVGVSLSCPPPHVPRTQQAMVAAALKTIFAQLSQEEAYRQLGEVADALDKKAPKAAERLRAAKEDVLAYMLFPSEHWRQLHSTNPLERLNKEIRRRTRVVGIFPTEDSLVRLLGMQLVEQDDEWQVAQKAYMSRGSMARLTAGEEPPLLLKETATGYTTRSPLPPSGGRGEPGNLAELNHLTRRRPGGRRDPHRQILAGHKSIATTMRDPGHLPGGARFEAIRRLTPRVLPHRVPPTPRGSPGGTVHLPGWPPDEK